MAHHWVALALSLAAIACGASSDSVSDGHASLRGERKLAAPPFINRFGLNYAGVTALESQYRGQGYRTLSVSVYSPSSPLYSIVMVQTSGPEWVTAWNLNPTTYQDFFNRYSALNYVPTSISVSGPSSSAVFAVLMEKLSVGYLARHGISESEFSTLNNQQGSMGRLLLTGAIYGTASDRRFAAVWVDNPGGVRWLARVSYSGDAYQRYFDGATQIPTRPHMVAGSDYGSYLAIFRDDLVGPWYAEHGVSAATHQATFDLRTSQGYFTPDQHVAGPAGSPLLTAIFTQNLRPIPKQWSLLTFSYPRGAPPQPSAPISALDAAFESFMKKYNIRAGQVAVAFKNKTVLSRAYTWAEESPAYSITNPSTQMRVASLSKAFTAASITQLIATPGSGIALTTKVYPYLGITSPLPSTATVDPRVKDITVDHLLRHAGGWLPGSPGGIFPEFNVNRIADAIGIKQCDSSSTGTLISKTQMVSITIK